MRVSQNIQTKQTNNENIKIKHIYIIENISKRNKQFFSIIIMLCIDWGFVENLLFNLLVIAGVYNSIQCIVDTFKIQNIN